MKDKGTLAQVDIQSYSAVLASRIVTMHYSYTKPHLAYIGWMLGGQL